MHNCILRTTEAKHKTQAFKNFDTFSKIKQGINKIITDSYTLKKIACGVVFKNTVEGWLSVQSLSFWDNY